MSYLDSQLRQASTQGDAQQQGKQIVSQARWRLSQTEHFRHHSNSISIDFQEGRLVLLGQLPTFYLKQVLQSVLRELPGVHRVDNRVEVVSVTGLSSKKRAP